VQQKRGDGDSAGAAKELTACICRYFAPKKEFVPVKFYFFFLIFFEHILIFLVLLSVSFQVFLPITAH